MGWLLLFNWRTLARQPLPSFQPFIWRTQFMPARFLERFAFARTVWRLAHTLPYFFSTAVFV